MVVVLRDRSVIVLLFIIFSRFLVCGDLLIVFLMLEEIKLFLFMGGDFLG